MKKLVNGIEVELSVAEKLEFDARTVKHLKDLKVYEAVKYKDDRKLEYPPIEDLVVALFEDKEGKGDMLLEMMAKRAAVKVKHPKPKA